MADDGSKQGATWPLPKFYFQVTFASLNAPCSFQEVSGLDVESQIIEYRHGDSQQFSTTKMPGLTKFGNVTLKRGIFLKDHTFWNWYEAISMNTVKRELVRIDLLDEAWKPTMSWTLTNAFPVKITATDLKSDGNEVAIETIELAHEGISISPLND